MKCEWVRENITLQVYGELADDARHELEQHVARCADCAAELKATEEFHELLSKAPEFTPSPNLVAASRMRLQEALETAEQGGFFRRLAFDPANWLRQVRFSPALASAILILGFAGGVGTAYKVLDHPPSGTAAVATPAPTEASSPVTCQPWSDMRFRNAPPPHPKSSNRPGFGHGSAPRRSLQGRPKSRPQSGRTVRVCCIFPGRRWGR